MKIDLTNVGPRGAKAGCPMRVCYLVVTFRRFF